jgi:hypothetical protein
VKGAGRRLLRLGLAVSVAAALLAAVGTAVGWREIGAVLATLDGRLAALALSLVILTRAAETLQMTWILRRSGLAVGPGRVLLAKSLGALYTLVLPGELMGGMAKWSSLAASTGQGSASLQGVVYNRAVLLCAEASLGLVALLLRPPWSSPWASAAVAGFAALVLATLALVYHPRSGSRLDGRLLTLADRWLPAAARRRAHRLAAAAAPFRAFAGRRHLGFYLAACGIVALRCLVLVTWSRSLGLAVPWLVLVWLKALLGFLRQLPVTVGGLGVRESAFVLLLAPFGVLPEQAFALGLLAFAGSLVLVATGLVGQALVALGVVRWRGAPAAPSGSAGGEEG